MAHEKGGALAKAIAAKREETKKKPGGGGLLGSRLKGGKGKC